MRTWTWSVRIFLTTLGLGLLYVYAFVFGMLGSSKMPLRHRVPTAQYTVLAHYCCTSSACRPHHLEYRFSYRWSE